MDNHWARPIADADAFAAEQARLVGVWTFLGLTSAAPNDGDWIRASIGGRSVFVQRFGDGLKGYENVCRHRFHPLRTADAGNGAIVCGYHHWRYDADGRAVDIPLCEQLFGGTAAQLGARLTPIEIGLCGELIFGRFAAGPAGPSLEDYLEDGFPILAALSRTDGRRWPDEVEARANWRLAMHITLEGYHIRAVHPTTLGKHGPPDPDQNSPVRFGLHSAQLSTRQVDPMAKMAAACRAGTWRSRSYRIFVIFPNLVVSHFHGGDQNWYVCVQQYTGLAHDRLRARCWIWPAAFPPAVARPWWDRWFGALTRPIRSFVVYRAHRKVMGEDLGVCEQVQTVAGQVERRPILGALEERIAWFEESYAAVVGRPPPTNP